MELPNIQFHFFPLLPKELRLNIWKYALPKPRLIDIELKTRTGLSSTDWRRNPTGPWYFHTPTSNINFPIFSMNYEARKLALEILESISIRTGLPFEDTNVGIRINFSCDTIYIGSYSLERLLENPRPPGPRDRRVVNSGHVADDHTPWSSKSQHLAVPLEFFLSSGPHSYRDDSHPRFSQFNIPFYRERAIADFKDIFSFFPALKVLLLVIDGRCDDFGGESEIVHLAFNTIAGIDDWYEPGARDLAAAWIPSVLDELRAEYPDVNVPSVSVALVVKEAERVIPERRWDFCRGECRWADEVDEGTQRTSLFATGAYS